MESKRSSDTAAAKIKGCLDSNYADTLALTPSLCFTMNLQFNSTILRARS